MMASNKIIIENETRPCYVNGKKALFHRWSERRQTIPESPWIGGHPAGFIAATLAIIELEDGTVKEVIPSAIKFADGGGFKDTAWREEKS